MSAVRLSATIVTYRSDVRFLEGALRSLAFAVLRARNDGLLSGAQVFIVDNSPPTPRGDLRKAIDAWPANAGALTLLQGHGNVGYGRANNLVLDKLDSDLHLILNPDVELYPDTLSAGLRAMQSHPNVGLLAPHACAPGGERLHLCKRYPSAWILFLRGFAPAALRRRFAATLDRYEMRDVPSDRFHEGIELASGCFMMVRTGLFRELGGFDPRFFMYFEDYDLSLRVGRSSAIAYAPDVRIVHHGGEASRKGWRHVTWFVASAWRFFRRHGWKLT